ncbi:MAG TPA: IgGFc-binding protein, partial [Nannocystis sp.]
SEGCEFWAVKTHLTKPASCFAAFIANTWDEPVHIEVEYDGQELDVGQFVKIPVGQGKNLTYGPYDPVAGLPPGQVAIAFLSRGPAVNQYDCPPCPVAPAIAEEVEVVDTGRGRGFRISTDRPVAAYQMLPYGSGDAAITSATLLLPTSVWDTNYVVINAYKQSALLAPAAKPLWAVIAAEDDTQITLDPKVAVEGGPGVSGGPAEVPIVYTLNRGGTIQFAQAAELTGSPLAANKPVGVFGGANCFNVPIDADYCDGANQQIPPIKALGSTYVAVRYKNRTMTNESPPWRLVGAVDGTLLTWSPAKPSGAPDTLSLGQVVEFNDPGPFVVRSQDSEHPFYLAAYMTGGKAYGERGDPEFVNVVPSEQYLDRYVFFTDPTYSETSLVVVRRKVDGSFADVNLGCAGTLGGWTAIDADHEYTRVDLVTGNFQGVGGCANGRHEISSLYPIGVTVWGWGGPESVDFYTRNVSYAYPAGAAIRPLNDVQIIPQ